MRLSVLIGWCALACVSVSPPAQADEWAAAREQTYHSKNGLYHLRVIPGHDIGDTVGFEGAQKGRSARAVLAGPGPKDERHIALLNPVAPIEAIVLDDGAFLTFDNWHNMGFGKVAVLYARDGAVRWSHELEQLLSAEVVGLVPRSVSSRWWRKSPLEWTLEGSADAATLTVTLWNEDRIQFHLSDGAVKYAAIENPGNDPQRLLARARASSDKASQAHGSYGAAIETFKRAIALDPRLIEAYQGLAEAYQHQEDHPDAIAALQEGIRRNPISESVASSQQGRQSDPRMQLRLELARAYEQANQLPEAERALQDCLRLDPAFWEAGKMLAWLQMKAGRQAEADALLAKFFELKKGNEGQWDSSYRLSQAGTDIGDVYENFGKHGQAKEYYLQAYGKGVVDQSLYSHLADAYEKLGELNNAREVLQALRAWMQQQKGYEAEVKRLDERMAHLPAETSVR